MSYIAIIRRNSDGLVRKYVMDDCDWEAETPESSGTLWVWTEGNYACDCNRYLCFQRAANEPEAEEDERCGHSAYSVLGIELPDGRCIPLFDEARKAGVDSVIYRSGPGYDTPPAVRIK